MAAVDFIKNKDLNGFTQFLNKVKPTICGRDAIRVLLALLPKNAKAHHLDYTTSGELTNDWTLSVSYVSMAFSGKWS